MNAERRPSFAEIVLSLEGLEREEGEEEKEEEHIALGKQNKTWQPTTISQTLRLLADEFNP